MGMTTKHWISVVVAALAIASFASCEKKAEQPQPAVETAVATPTAGPILVPDDEVHAQYAGSETCKDCHAAIYKNWLVSNHGQAERALTKERDYPAFLPGEPIAHGDDTTTPFVDSDELAKFLAIGKDNQRHTFEAVRVIGNDPLQQFLVPAPGGRLQTQDLSWDPHHHEWFDVFGENDQREPGDWGHWTGQGMNWNAMCAACHNTRLRKHYDPQSNSYHTTMVEMSVGCEACHGPAKEHVDWQQKFSTGKDPTLPRFSRDQVMETCAACHARRAELTGDLIPGDSFHDHFSLTIPDATDIYHPDGQVRDENYEFTAFLGSRMHHAGVRCADCHEPHSTKTIVPGNMLCMTCHAGGRDDFPTSPIIDPVAHSRHGADSTGNQCISCHMPVTTYMQRHPRHDHGFTIPDPRFTKESGTPNACNRCHTDKDTDWAIHAYKEMFGEKPNRPERTRALLIASARRGDPAARDGLIRHLAAGDIPLWQASATDLLGRWVLDPEARNPLLTQLKHESPLVREAAVRSLGELARDNDEGVRSALKPLLEDPIRSVRIATAWALCDTLDLTTRAGRELTHMLDLHADQPTGRMQLAQFTTRRGNPKAGIGQMRKAIEWDPLSPPFYHDLAILLNITGDAPGAVKELRKAIELDPQNPEYHYKLALALNETGATAESLKALEKTVQLDSGYGRAWYNLGLAYSAANQPQQAVAALLRGEAAAPADAAIPYARATIHARLGQRNEAVAAAASALQIRPDFPEARQLLQMLAQ